MGGLVQLGDGVHVVSRTSGERRLTMMVGEAMSGIASSVIQPAETVAECQYMNIRKCGGGGNSYCN